MARHTRRDFLKAAATAIAPLAVLKETGRAEDTIVIFADDSGLGVGRHGLMGKQNLYEHGIHVPLIICGPGIPASFGKVTPHNLLRTRVGIEQ